MKAPVDSLLVLVLLINLFLLGTSRLRAVIAGSALQGVILGALAVLLHFSLQTLVVAVGAIVVRGLVIPRLLHKAMRDLAIHREVEPFIGFVPSLFLGAVGTGLALVFSSTLPLAEAHKGSLIVPASFATVLTGFLILTTRRKAIT